MADRRNFTPTHLGFPGLLVYIPSENLQEKPGLVETSRFTSRFPHFNILGPVNTVYPPPKTHLPETSSKLWRERRAQERWLFKSRPEVFMGNTAFQDILKEDMLHFKISEDASHGRSLLAVGHMPDLGVKSGARVLSVTAVASGQSGELLRLARSDDTLWQWGDNSDAILNLSTIDPANREAETIWASDGLPILQVKFEGTRLEDESLRWLLVQKQTSTTILRPEYRDALTASSRPNNMSIEQRPSFLSPNPLTTIYHHQTGGSAHSDVTFLPTDSERSPQIAIIDECGHWSIWDLQGAWKVRQKVATRLSLNKCGHISEGLLGEVPSSSSYPAQRHGLVVVEQTEMEHSKKASSQSSKSGIKTETTARHLVIWNREKFEVLDLNTNTFLLKMQPLLTEKRKPDWILDIQRSPTRQSHVLILTENHITWVDIFGLDTSGKAAPKPSVILSCAHLGSKYDDTKMFVCRASHDDEDTLLVFIQYPQSQQLCIFWFTFSKHARIPQWHRDTISLPGAEDIHAQKIIQGLRVDQARLAASIKESAASPGIDYHQKGVRFYQLSFLDSDLSLQQCLCAISQDSTVQIRIPEKRVAWADAKLQKERDRRRRLLIDHIEGAFTLPDELTTDGIDEMLRGEQEGDASRQSNQVQEAASRTPKPVFLKIDRLVSTIQLALENSINKGITGLPYKLFEVLRQTLDDGREQSRLPLLTWAEAAETVLRSEEYESPDNPMKEDIERLLDENDKNTVVTQLRRFNGKEGPESLVSLQYLQQSFYEFWLKPVEDILPTELQQIRAVWVAELARDAFLSNYGIMVQDTLLLGSPNLEKEGKEDEESRGTPSSSQIRSSQITPSSRSSSRGIEASPSRSEESTVVDGAIQRLQLLAPSLQPNKFGASRQSKILSYWPTERGVDPADYVSSVAKANEELFRDAKERLHRIETKRKSRAELYKRPAFMRQGLPDLDNQSQSQSQTQSRPPPVQIMSSQAAPESSQPQGPFVTMSQPVSGVFGDRKKTKKAKRKSGFR